MLCDFGSNVTINFDDFYCLKWLWEFANVLVCDAAVRIPLSSEIYDKKGKFVACQVVIQQV